MHLAQTIPVMGDIRIVFLLLGVSALAGMTGILMALCQEFGMATTFSFFAIMTSVLPAALIQLRTETVVFFDWVLPSALGIVAFGICNLESDYRQSKGLVYLIVLISSSVIMLGVALTSLSNLF